MGLLYGRRALTALFGVFRPGQCNAITSCSPCQFELTAPAKDSTGAFVTDRVCRDYCPGPLGAVKRPQRFPM
jgi:hypothetical protein